jgi:hypothetical protein
LFFPAIVPHRFFLARRYRLQTTTTNIYIKIKIRIRIKIRIVGRIFSVFGIGYPLQGIAYI